MALRLPGCATAKQKGMDSEATVTHELRDPSAIELLFADASALCVPPRPPGQASSDGATVLAEHDVVTGQVFAHLRSCMERIGRQLCADVWACGCRLHVVTWAVEADLIGIFILKPGPEVFQTTELARRVGTGALTMEVPL
eukprot:825747-Amphidinium_carterae.1